VLTDEELTELERTIAESGLKLPLRATTRDADGVAGYISDANGRSFPCSYDRAVFFAASVNALPVLLAELRAVRGVSNGDADGAP